MRKLFSLLIFSGLLYSVEIGGEAKLNNFYYIFSTDSIKPVPYMFHQFEIEFSQTAEKYDFTGSLLFRLWAQNSAFSISELSTPSFNVKPHIWELYLTIYGFIFNNLDLKIGKQRISWGTADKLNPTDILNPYDLQNPFDFGKKMPSEAVVFDLYLPKEFTFEGVLIPEFVPPLLPEGFPIFQARLPVIDSFSPSLSPGIKDTIIYPESKNFKNSMFAGKIYGKLFKWDFSLSYFYGFDNIPLIKNILIYPDTSGVERTIIEYFFPRIQMIGFDFAGELYSIGIWGELGYFMPIDKIKLPFPLSSHIMPEKFENPYLKSTIGFDYTFTNGIYINLQWNHGFFFEKGEELHEYLVGRIEKKFLRDRLKTGIACIGEGAEEDYGGAVVPEISYKPHDNVEINMGAIILDGTTGTLLGSWKDFDQFYLNLKVEF